MLVTSFKGEVQVVSGPYFIPFVDFKPTLDAWNFMLVQNNTIGPYLNSLVVALSSTVLALLIGSLAAYALVRIRFQVKLAAVLVFLVLLIAVIVAVATLGVPWPVALASRPSRSSCSRSARSCDGSTPRSATTISSSG